MLHRFGQSTDYVAAAIFLASEAARYMTGQSSIIDGGVLCQQVPRLQFMSPPSQSMSKGTRNEP